MAEVLTVGSICTGAGGFDLGVEAAAGVLGFEFEIKWQIEIDDNANAVLNRHWPNVKRYRDLRDVSTEELEPVDLIVAGPPCQGFSVAGLRKGLDDERSNLWYQTWRVIRGLTPRWVVIENVPGLLSSGPAVQHNGKTQPRRGIDFAIMLAGLTGYVPTIPKDGWKSAGFMCGRSDSYNVCWRIVDSQFFGLPQRRRRVFIVGNLTTAGAGCTEVLFEPESRPWDTAPRREKGEAAAAVAGTLSANAGGVNRPAENANELDFCVPVVSGLSGTLTARMGKDGASSNNSLDTNQLIAYGGGNSKEIEAATVYAVTERTRNGEAVLESQKDLSYALLSPKDGGRSSERMIAIAPTLSTKNEVASSSTQRERWYTQSAEMLGTIRRLTPTECERLQGFPDGFTAWGIDTDGNSVIISDTQRYKMMGNAVSVPVIAWIIQRLWKAQSN